MLGALALWLLQGLAAKNLPLIGDYLAQVVLLVQTRIH